ncbi:MAG: TRAP transporter small permease subunit [Xanthomonadales bacterium]|nr:TRAP transporter small permease subunit [Gammaproteobacteria bacterium]MBT8052857.1 TRAP transporter small permease subunit [Gammaproteobacteria bacterium]NND55682.1 TRAP transporter small permease subunit [Xanthomonadales bacterium]NNK49993.1 TRAP transporter small permease subunit [Xanthomonadales bacterium]
MEVKGPTGSDGGGGVAARIVRWLGLGVSWLTLAMVLLTFGIVVLRYGFNQGWIWLQESVTYLHAMVFMIAAAWAYQADDHVRVDIFYRGKSERYQNWVNLLGTLIFLVPLSVFMLLIGWDYVTASWATMESSREAGGLPLVFILKSLILVLPALLLLQSWSTARTCVEALREG